MIFVSIRVSNIDGVGCRWREYIYRLLLEEYYESDRNLNARKLDFRILRRMQNDKMTLHFPKYYAPI